MRKRKQGNSVKQLTLKHRLNKLRKKQQGKAVGQSTSAHRSDELREAGLPPETVEGIGVLLKQYEHRVTESGFDKTKSNLGVGPLYYNNLLVGSTAYLAWFGEIKEIRQSNVPDYLAVRMDAPCGRHYVMLLGKTVRDTGRALFDWHPVFVEDIGEVWEMGWR